MKGAPVRATMPAETWTVASTDGTPIGVHTHGQGPPVVLVHGTACDHRVFDRVARRFAKRFTVHALDRRGRGASGDADAYALEREAEDVAAVVEQVADDAGAPVALVGHSLGGIVALEATTRTDAVDRLVVYEPPIHGEDRPGLEAVDALETLLETEGPEAAVEAFLAEVEYSPAMIDRVKANEAYWQATLDTAETIPREARAGLTYELDPFALARIDVPVLVMVGSQSPPMFRDAAARLKANLSDARVEVVQGASHGVLHQAPDAFVDAVEAFVEEAL